MSSLCAVAALAVQACAAGAALSTYPRSQIYRPYTLPSGVHEFSSAAAVGFGRDDFDSSQVIGLRPISWRLPLSDDWTLDLNPLPSGISHQLLRTDDHLLGARLSWGLGFGSDGVLLAPMLTVSHRMRLARSLAWSTAAFGSASRWTEQSSWSWSTGFAAGPLWQLTDTFSLRPGIGLVLARTHLLLPRSPLQETARVIVPVGLGASLSVARQWDIEASFTYDRIGYADGYAVYTGSFAVVHFW